jgi:NADPH:quinone reductase-like Zn-dependent oxidoreductase
MKSVVAHKPATIDFPHAAALPTSALAALTALRSVELKEDETVLINGATGGVGRYAVQMATRCGARVIATAKPRAEASIRELGAASTTHAEILSIP